MSSQRQRKEVPDPIAVHEEFRAGRGKSLVGFATSPPGEASENPRAQIPRPRQRKGDKSGWQQQTIVLPPELRKWLKHYAVDHDAEISDIATWALEEYRQRHKDD